MRGHIIPKSLIFLILMVAGCKGDAERSDFADYINYQAKVQAPVENGALDTLQKTTAGLSDMHLMATDLRNGVINKLRQVILKEKDAPGTTDELKELKLAHVKVLTDLIAGVTELADGLENKDLKVLQQGKDDSDKAKADVEAFRNRVRSAAKEHGVELTEAANTKK